MQRNLTKGPLGDYYVEAPKPRLPDLISGFIAGLIFTVVFVALLSVLP